LKIPCAGNILSKSKLPNNREAMCWKLKFITEMVLFQEIRVFLQLSSVGLFGTKKDCLQLAKLTLPEVFILKVMTIHRETMC
jgi:hypothetical protein